MHYYASIYADTLPFQKKYETARDPESYIRAHESKLILHDGARRKLKQMGLDPSKADPLSIQKDINKLEKMKKQLASHHKASLREAAATGKKLDELSKYLNPESPGPYTITPETRRPRGDESRS